MATDTAVSTTGGHTRLGSAPQGRFFEEVAERWVVDKG